MSQVILIHTLKDFLEEVPSPATVRLCAIEQTKGSGVVPILTVMLQLQGVNAEGQIVWLYEEWNLQRSPGSGSDKFWRPLDKSVYEQTICAKYLIAEHLQTMGYNVRPGQYGIPDDIKPVRGDFDCLRWTRVDEDTVRVELREETEETPSP